MEYLNRIAKVAYSTVETIKNTYMIAQLLDEYGIQGDYVECGVAAGAQIMTMKMASPQRTIWGFDSFKGIPLAGRHDEEQPGIGEITHDVEMPLRERLISSGITVHTKSNVVKNFNIFHVPLRNVNLVEGWFQDTLPNIEIEKIALLRLDGDLYESTMVCLENLYPLVVEHGAIIIDDYALAGCRKAVHDYFGNDLPTNIVPVIGGMGVVYWFK